MYLKMRYLGVNKAQDEYDRCWLNHYNLVRIEGLLLWNKSPDMVNEGEMVIRLNEVAFNNATFMARLHNEMATIDDFTSAGKAEQFRIMSEAFAVHSVISYLGDRVYSCHEVT